MKDPVIESRPVDCRRKPKPRHWSKLLCGLFLVVLSAAEWGGSSTSGLLVDSGGLPALPHARKKEGDWLISTPLARAGAYRGDNDREVVLDKGRLGGITVIVHYELYDGLPLLGKWITIRNGTTQTIQLDSFVSEMLAVVEAESAVDDRKEWRQPLLNLISDYSFHGMDATTASQTTAWLPDPQYTSQVNYNRKTPALLVSRSPLGPGLRIAPLESFRSFRTYVVIHDSDGRERQGMAMRRVLRALAPWSTENPVMMHVRSADLKTFRNAVDQCAATGFEMIIYTFGSGLNMENNNPGYMAQIKADVDYAHAKGIEVGAYSLGPDGRTKSGSAALLYGIDRWSADSRAGGTPPKTSDGSGVPGNPSGQTAGQGRHHKDIVHAEGKHLPFAVAVTLVQKTLENILDDASFLLALLRTPRVIDRDKAYPAGRQRMMPSSG